MKRVLHFALGCAAAALAQAGDFSEFDTQGLPRSQGIVVRVSHPAHWRKVPSDDEMAIAELRGTEAGLTGILQIGRGRQRSDMESLCRPERASTMLRGLTEGDPDTRVTDVVARTHQGRPAFALRYERNSAPTFMVVHSLIVCLKDSQLLVSCAGEAGSKIASTAIAPVCARVLESIRIAED
jgi:hypothetical protein